MCKKSGDDEERYSSQARYFSAVLLCVTQGKILQHGENRSFVITGFLNKDGAKQKKTTGLPNRWFSARPLSPGIPEAVL
jgi:hypothetical protein